MHLHELLDMSIADYEVERARIEKLFFYTRVEQGGIVDHVSFPSLAAAVRNDFQLSKMRGTAISIGELFETCSRYWQKPSLEGLLLYCELVWNAIAVGEKSIRLFDCTAALANQTVQNITIILEKTGHEIVKRRDGLYEILKKDALASATVADLDNRDVASAILDYIHFGMKGAPAKKRELLVTIGRYVEPLLDDEELKSSQPGLVSDVGFCLNNLHIRHNNEEGKHAKHFLETMPSAELEDWYDKAYRSMLLLVEQEKQLETHSQIAALRQAAKGEKA